MKRMHPFHLVPENAVKVEHPNVVETLGVMRRPGELLAAMEYVPGASLQEICELHPDGLEPHLASTILAGVLHGLHAGHEARDAVLPRGLSPSSILVGDDGHPRLLDLDVHGPSTAAAAMDKLPYAAPEQVARSDVRLDVRVRVDVRRDVWAAGVVLWETLTGRSLFRAPSVEGTLHAIRWAEVTPPSHHVWSDVDPALDAIVMRALDRDPDARFASAREMAIALEQTSWAMPDDLACALAEMDMRSISLRKVLADAVTRRERSALHIECNDGVSKE